MCLGDTEPALSKCTVSCNFFLGALTVESLDGEYHRGCSLEGDNLGNFHMLCDMFYCIWQTTMDTSPFKFFKKKQNKNRLLFSTLSGFCSLQGSEAQPSYRGWIHICSVLS